VELAIADVFAGVVGVAERDGNDDEYVEDEGGQQESPEPVLVWARSDIKQKYTLWY